VQNLLIRKNLGKTDHIEQIPESKPPAATRRSSYEDRQPISSAPSLLTLISRFVYRESVVFFSFLAIEIHPSEAEG